MKLAFLSDIHLDFVIKSDIEKLAYDMSDCDAAVITGDIATSSSLFITLNILADNFKKPIYFLCGNHDFYKSSFKEVEQATIKYSDSNKYCKWLQHIGIVELTPNTCLLGADGWYDLRLGDYWNSNFGLTDFAVIKDLIGLSKEERYKVCSKRGDDCADYIRDVLPEAAKKYKNIIFATHVPPFQGASLYKGRPSPQYSLPYFSNKAAGMALLDIAEWFPDRKFLVICGHSHFAADYQIKNITVKVAGAEYYEPKVYATIEPE